MYRHKPTNQRYLTHMHTTQGQYSKSTLGKN